MDQISQPIKILGIITLLAGGWFFISNGEARTGDDLGAIAPITPQGSSYNPSTAARGPSSGGSGDTRVSEGPAGIQTYAPNLVESAGDAKVLLLFTTRQCSSCQTLKNNINANRFLIPDGLRILEVDMDRNVDLVEEFKVPSAGRLVLINSAWGWQKTFGAGSFEDILDTLGM